MMSQRIGRVLIVGPTCSGKGTLAMMLAGQIQYKTFSRYNIVREYATSKSMENPTWRQIWDIEHRMLENDTYAIIDEIIKRIGKTHVIIEGSRCPHEVEYLKNQDTATLVIGIDASEDATESRKIRWQRMSQRGRSDDPKTPEEFGQNDDIEWGRVPDYRSLNLLEAMKLSDLKIYNSSRVEDLGPVVQKLLQTYCFI